MTKEKKTQLKNHIPTIKHLCELFLHCLDAPNDMDEEAEKDYLLEVLNKMSVQWQGAKEIVEE